MPKNKGELAAELARLRKEKGLTQAKLAELAKVDQGNVAHVEGGDRNFKGASEFATRISAALGVPVSHWFPFTSDGPALLAATQTAPSKETAKPKLPTLYQVDPADTVPKALLPNNTGTLVMFRVRGQSMTKKHIQDGSLLFVRIDPAPRVGEKVVAAVNSRKKRGPRGYVVKILKQGDEWMELHSASEEEPAEPMIVDDTVDVVGVVVGVFNT